MKGCEEIALLSNNDQVIPQDKLVKEEILGFWMRVAVVLLLTSVVIQLGFGGAILVFAFKERTPGGLGLGIDIILDVLTTLVVLWRYLFRKNERRACVLISILFIISGIALNIKAAYNLSKEWIPYFKPNILLPIESTISVTFCALMIAKIYVSKKLESKSLFVDGINTGCGLLMAIMNLVSLLVYRKTNLWFLDSVSAIVISLFLFFFGIKLLLSFLNSKTDEDD